MDTTQNKSGLTERRQIVIIHGSHDSYTEESADVASEHGEDCSIYGDYDIEEKESRSRESNTM